jgi:hypothetical protein
LLCGIVGTRSQSLRGGNTYCDTLKFESGDDIALDPNAGECLGGCLDLEIRDVLVVTSCVFTFIAAILIIICGGTIILTDGLIESQSQSIGTTAGLPEDFLLLMVLNPDIVSSGT